MSTEAFQLQLDLIFQLCLCVRICILELQWVEEPFEDSVVNGTNVTIF